MRNTHPIDKSSVSACLVGYCFLSSCFLGPFHGAIAVPSVTRCRCIPTPLKKDRSNYIQKIWRCSFRVIRADRQTDKQTNSSQYFTPLLERNNTNSSKMAIAISRAHTSATGHCKLKSIVTDIISPH